ncbi:FAD-dependent oxidoreductase [Streptomyces clavuligerus]|uniref:FAD-dependent oxidoreductase n=1 Tax=Streptomyces clavuligerus TaxID=1901 RepID=UPI0018D0DEA3|nr:FAD-dependent oxidoreductase [Streptomyces clavuligerus]
MTGEVIVVGGGVSGLTTAVVLAEQGHRVRVRTREPAELTTSAVAGGLWLPYRIEPGEQVARWSVESFAVYEECAADPGTTGVRMVPGVLAGQSPDSLGAWARLPLIDMPAHLGWLRRRLEAAGGAVESRAVGSLTEAAATAATVVNCTGLAARELVPDPGVRPLRGQLVLVENPGVTEWFCLEDEAEEAASLSTYLLPQPGRLVLGGTVEDGDRRLEPDPATAAAIVARCARFFPGVAKARVLGHRVGLRPLRPAGVRIGAEPLPGGGLLVHNYGHGGAGVTVAWGCARAAAALVPAA